MDAERGQFWMLIDNTLLLLLLVNYDFFLFLLPHNSLNNSDEIGMGFWNLNDGSLVMQSLGRIKIDFERDHLTYDIGNNQYNLKIGPTTYIYR